MEPLDLQVIGKAVARLSEGKDPGDLAQSAPEALAQAVDDPMPFLGFRVNRTLQQRRLDSPEQRARAAEEAMAVVNEHPNANVRKLYAGEVAARVGLPATDLVRMAEQRIRRPSVEARALRRTGPTENAEFAALVLLSQEWDSIAEWLVDELFFDETNRLAFVALAEGGGLDGALALASPEAREVLERAAVADLELDATQEAFNLIRAAVRRELADSRRIADPDIIRANSAAKLDLEALSGSDGTRALAAAESLLAWLHQRSEQRTRAGG